MNLHKAFIFFQFDYPFLSEVLVSLLLTCSDTYLRPITSERARSDHKPVPTRCWVSVATPPIFALNFAILFIHTKWLTEMCISRPQFSPRSKAYVCGRSIVGIAGSNPAYVTDLRLVFVVSYVGSGLRDGLITRSGKSYRACVFVCVSKAGETLSSRHVSTCDVTRAVGMWEAI